MQTVIKAKTAADFLALVPALAGYTPVRSVALVAFHGARTLGVLRVDVPPPGADAEALASAAATFIGLVCRLPDADGIAPVVYCDEQLFPSDSRRPPHAALIDALRRCADACGLVVKDALCVAADAWCSYLEPGTPAHPLSELDAAAARAPLPTGTIPTRGDQHSGVELPTMSSIEQERVEGAVERLTQALQALGGCGLGDDTDPVDWLDDSRTTFGPPASGIPTPRDAAVSDTARALGALCNVPALFENALEAEPHELGLDTIAALLICLERPPMRDAALTQWAFDLEAGERLLDAQIAWEDGADFPPHLAAHMLGAGPRPDIARIEAALGLVRYLAAIAPTPLRCAPLTVAAWLSWALGRSTHASAYLALVREIDPDYGLAEIVSTMVENGHLPNWAFDRTPPNR